MKEKVRKLWKLCFHDSPAFTDLYFQMRYNNEVNIAIQSGDLVIAALQMLPYPMTYCGKTIATSYVSGACTHPDFRNKGVMRELLAESFGKMHQVSCYPLSFRPNHGCSTITPKADIRQPSIIRQQSFTKQQTVSYHQSMQ